MERLHIRAIIEILGYPKDHIENTMELILKKLKEEKDVEYLSDKIHEAKETGKLFSTFAEVEFKLPTLENLIDFCFNYMPSSIEILSPEKFNLETSEVSGFLNDLMARLHRTDMLLKNIIAENKVLKIELEKKK